MVPAGGRLAKENPLGMSLNADQLKLIATFRDWMESAVDRGDALGVPQRQDREDHSTLATRWPAGEHTWLELTVRPFIPQVRSGIMTDDRRKNEQLEQMIEDSGDTVREFVDLGFEAAGLDWSDPPVEHYRDQGKYFYFATPLDLESIRQLGEQSLRDKVKGLLNGYRRAFTSGDQ